MINQNRKGRATYEPFMEPARVTEWKGFGRYDDLDAATKISWPSSSAYASTYASTDARLNANGSTKRCESYTDDDRDVFVPRVDSCLSARGPADSFSSRSTTFSSSRNADAYRTNRRASRDGEPTYLHDDTSGQDTFGLNSLARLNEVLREMDGCWDTATAGNDTSYSSRAPTHNADVPTAAASHGWATLHQQWDDASRGHRREPPIDAYNKQQGSGHECAKNDQRASRECDFLSRDVYRAQRGNTDHRFSHHLDFDKKANSTHIFPMVPQSHDFDFDRQQHIFPMLSQSHTKSRQQHNFPRRDAYSTKSTGLNDDNYCPSSSTVQGHGRGGLFEPTSSDINVPSRSKNNDSEQQRSPTDASTVPSQGSNNDNDSWVEQRVGNADVSDSRGEEEPPTKEKPFETRLPRRLKSLDDLRLGKMLQRKEIKEVGWIKKNMGELINARCLSPEDLNDAFTSLKKNKDAVTMWDIVKHLSTSLNIAKEDMLLEFHNRYFCFNEQGISKIQDSHFENPTTMMLRNIPRRQGRDQLEKLLEKTGFPCGIAYNFLYLPYCLDNGQNLGYAFINFLTTELASDFTKKWHKQRVMGSLKSRPLNVSVAQVQGKRANLDLVLPNNKAYKLTDRKLQPIVSGPDGIRTDLSRFHFEQLKAAGGRPEDTGRPNTIPKNKKSLRSRSSQDEDSERVIAV